MGRGRLVCSVICHRPGKRRLRQPSSGNAVKTLDLQRGIDIGVWHPGRRYEVHTECSEAFLQLRNDRSSGLLTKLVDTYPQLTRYLDFGVARDTYK